MYVQSSAETYIRFIMNSIGGKTLSPDIIGTATISGAKLFLMKDLKLIYIFQDKLIIKFYFKVTKRNANLPFLSVNFPSVCSEITSQIVCKFLQIIVCTPCPRKVNAPSKQSRMKTATVVFTSESK